MAGKGMAPVVTIGEATYLSFAEVARRTDVSGETVRRWVTKKLLKTIFVKGRQMIGAKDLEAFLEPTDVEPGVLIPGLGRSQNNSVDT